MSRKEGLQTVFDFFNILVVFFSLRYEVSEDPFVFDVPTSSSTQSHAIFCSSFFLYLQARVNESLCFSQVTPYTSH